MQYWQLNCVFLAAAGFVLATGLLRSGRRRADWQRCADGRAFRRRRLAAALAGTAGALLALTAVFDNAMIAVGLFDYADGPISGVRLGLAPVEDFAYPAAAAMLLPGLWLLFGAEDGPT